VSESVLTVTAGSTTLLFNAAIRMLDDAGSVADALAWRDQRLIAVGRHADVVREAGPGAENYDARGATVLPGFIDAHQHPSIAALYGGGVLLTPPAVSDIATLQRTLADASAALPAGEWLVATDWDEGMLAERRPPTRHELDDAVPDRPLFALHYTCHRALANSRALELAGIDAATPEPAGGAISRGSRGLPDGLLIERGMSRVESLARASLCARDVEGFFARLGKHYRDLAAAGITRVVDAAVPRDLAELYREAQRRGLVTIPTLLMPVSTAGYLEPPWDALEGPVTGATDGLLTVGPLKLVLDGAPGCAMCLDWWQLAGASLSSFALSVQRGSLDPLRLALSLKPRFGRKLRTGIKLCPPAEARDLVRSAAERGFAVATHAEGNEAIADALSAYEGSASALDRGGPPRLEHMIFAGRELCGRIAGTGAAAVVQPYFLSLPAFANAPSIPGLATKPLRWLLDAGVVVAGSSDFPVTGFDPLDGIRAAVRRKREPDQELTIEEALALYTRNAARAIGAYGECGSLEAGKRADLVVIDGGLASYADLQAARVRATIVGGAVAYGRIQPHHFSR
jgi:predicted amidohydrolase YtcJ